MNLSQIIIELQKQAANTGKIILADSLWNQGFLFSSLVKEVLRRSKGNIILSVSSIPDIKDGKVSFIAGVPDSADDTFLSLNERRATVELHEKESIVHLILSIELRTKYIESAAIEWEFGDSFPELDVNMINNLSLSNQKLVFQYDDANADPSRELGFSADYTWNGILGVYKNIITAFNGTPANGVLQGKIYPTKNKVKSLFYAPLSLPEFDLVKLKVNNFSLEVNQMWLEEDRGKYPWLEEPEPWTEFSLKGSTILDGVPGSIDTFLYALPGDYAPDKIGVSVRPAENNISTSLANLAKWMSGNREEVDKIIKNTPFETFFEMVGFKSFSFEFDLKTETYLSLLRLQTGTLDQWHISEHLTVIDITLDWLLLNPLDKPIHIIELRGGLKMKSGDKELLFLGLIELPGPNLSMMLKTEQKLTVPEWLEIIIISFGGSPLPDHIKASLKEFKLKSMAFSYQHPTNSGTFTLSSTILAGDKIIDFEVYLHVNFAEGTYDVQVAFILGDITIYGEITNEKIPEQTIIFCDVESENQILGLDYLPSLMGYGPLGIPSELDIALNKVGIIYDFTDKSFAMGAHSINYGTADLVVFKPQEKPNPALFAGVHIDKQLDLTRLPLVGKVLSALHTLQINEIEVFITSRQFTSSEAIPLKDYVSLLENQLKGKYPSFPNDGMTSSIGISLNLDVAGYIIPIMAGLGGTSDSGMPSDKSGQLGIPEGDTSKPVHAAPPDQSDGSFWITIQKSIGPLSFRRVGIKYNEGKIWLALDCSLNAGSLKIDLIGASLGVPLSGFHPKFEIEGLGIEFKGPGLDIGGSLLKVSHKVEDQVEWEYAGGAIIKMMDYSLSAWGSYANIYKDTSHTKTIPSMFLFVQFTGTLGGVPFFMVTGLSGGFGYNSRLRLPQIDEVYQFPFVAYAGSPDSKDSLVGSQSPAEVLRNLFGINGGKPWLSHEAGQYWLALGIMFTSFELITTNALLIGEFGNSFKLALIGLSRGKFPTVGPKTFAFVELQIELIIDVEKGSAGLRAQQSSNSYILDPNCKITGGFAFYTWFAPSPYAGDFVLTIGGYHSQFKPPKYYPEVPRVGINWLPDNYTSISGSSYFAITPAAIMAGGMLNVNYHKGDFKAWLKAWTDFLMYWHPFHFDVSIGVTVGASYRLNLWFIHHTFSGEFGVDLNLYGPKTGARLTVHIWKVKINVDIGPDKTSSKPLPWKEFAETLLPPKKDLLKFIPKEGIIASDKNVEKSSSEAIHTRVSGCRIQLIASIPCSKLLINEEPLETNSKIYVRPMGDESGTPSFDFICNLEIRDQSGNLVSDQWTITPSYQNVPKALWGKYVGHIEQGDEQLLKKQLTGYDIESPYENNETVGIYDTIYNVYPDPFEGIMPLKNLDPMEASAKTSETVISIIKSEIASHTVDLKRNALFNDLKQFLSIQAENEKMDTYAKNASTLLRDFPLIII
ncbi:DUF6603 domain-containing protein [Chryseobacterium indologenes]|uniref:DUF6603 domain-containing protein n=1 Tax=Chryseobacterium indologenes TaxID=253 RepID=UPI0006479723|nr:DUF6603 domain-containing protein [Chryseobacterium indologenes]